MTVAHNRNHKIQLNTLEYNQYRAIRYTTIQVKKRRDKTRENKPANGYNTTDYNRVQSNTIGYDRIQQDTIGYSRIQWATKEYNRIK